MDKLRHDLSIIEDKLRYSINDEECGKLTYCREEIKRQITQININDIIKEENEKNKKNEEKQVLSNMFEIKHIKKEKYNIKSSSGTVLKPECQYLCRYFHQLDIDIETKNSDFFNFMYVNFYRGRGYDDEETFKHKICHFAELFSEKIGYYQKFHSYFIDKTEIKLKLSDEILIAFVVLYKINIAVIKSSCPAYDDFSEGSFIFPKKDYPIIYIYKHSMYGDYYVAKNIST